MVKLKSQSIAQKMENARLLIEGAIHQPLINQELAKYGYPLKEIQKGKALLEKVVLLQSQKSTKYGAQFSASEQFKQDQTAAWDKYIYHIKVAKLAFRNDLGKQRQLQLNVARKRNLAGWLEQARFFYQEIQGMAAEMEQMGVTASELSQAQAMIEAVADTKRSYKGLEGEAQLATQERNIALKALEDWVRKFTKAARLALDENDQLLEGLGLMVPTRS
jgi:hypothetical protein